MARLRKIKNNDTGSNTGVEATLWATEGKHHSYMYASENTHFVMGLIFFKPSSIYDQQSYLAQGQHFISLNAPFCFAR
jgi:hypothetical protein